MGLEIAMQANVRQDMSSKQVKQLARFALISVLNAVQMILDRASNVVELVIKMQLRHV
jgi:hypothetical protein